MSHSDLFQSLVTLVLVGERGRTIIVLCADRGHCERRVQTGSFQQRLTISLLILPLVAVLVVGAAAAGAAHDHDSCTHHLEPLIRLNSRFELLHPRSLSLSLSFPRG